MIARHLTLVLTLSTLPLGCAEMAVQTHEGTGLLADAKSIDEGTPEAIGLLSFLNDAGTTMAVLDDDVPLDRRAAGNLISHRNGGDDTYGTSDDDLFGSVAEVDAVRWVGPKSLDRLLSYADSLGYVPSGEETLGTWDRVSFSVNEAEWTLFVVNDEEAETLDVTVALDSRAVDSIMAARPIASVEDLAGLYYVGTSALEKILDFAVDRYYEEPEEEEVNCFPVLTATADADAEDYTRLLELTTFVDNPYAEVTTFDFSGCDNWNDSEEATALVNQALWEATYRWTWGESGYFREVAVPAVGGNEFTSQLNRTLVVIDEHTADGDWDPTQDLEAAGLYAQRQALVDALKADVLAAPGEFREVWMYADLIECSEEAAALIHEDGSVTIVHQLQNC